MPDVAQPTTVTLAVAQTANANPARDHDVAQPTTVTLAATAQTVTSQPSRE